MDNTSALTGRPTTILYIQPTKRNMGRHWQHSSRPTPTSTNEKTRFPEETGKKEKYQAGDKVHTHGVPAALSARTEPKQSKQHQQRRQQRRYKSHATSTRSPCATKRRRHQARMNIDPLPLIQHSHLCSNSKSATNEARLCTPRDRRRSIIECWVNLKNSDLETSRSDRRAKCSPFLPHSPKGTRFHSATY